MNVSDLWAWVLATAQGSLVGAVAILVIFIGAAIGLDVVKLRRRGRAGARSLEELVGDPEQGRFLPPDTPRGPIDQLKAGTSGGGPA
jgi:hypothetical protein